MNQKDIIDFFDNLAQGWDNEPVNNAVINKIIDITHLKQGARVLDVACGTGVMVPFYLQKGATVVGVDISAKMIEIARKKFAQPQVAFVVADVEKADLPDDFDYVMVHNALPHFISPHDLIKSLCTHTAPMGRITVAHSISKAKLDEHHQKTASKVSMGLIDENELSRIMSAYVDVDIIISDDEKYIVSGIKK